MKKSSEWNIIEITEVIDGSGNIKRYSQPCGQVRAKTWAAAIKEYLFSQYMDNLKHIKYQNGIGKIVRYACCEVKENKR